MAQRRYDRGSARPRSSRTGFVRDLAERQQTEERLEELEAEIAYITRVATLG